MNDETKRIFEAAKEDCERAYRRGVHQTLASLDRFIHEHLDADPASVIDIACAFASDFRVSTEAHSLLLNELFQKVEGRLP